MLGRISLSEETTSLVSTLGRGRVMEIRRRSVFSMIAGALGFGAAAKAAVIMGEADAERHDYYKWPTGEVTSPDGDFLVPYKSYDRLRGDYLEIRRKLESALRVIRERSPKGNVDVFYPCGCSSTGPVITEDGGGSPFYCGEHNPDAKLGAACSVAFGEQRASAHDIDTARCFITTKWDNIHMRDSLPSCYAHRKGKYDPYAYASSVDA
jgi:hypothetical protein